MNTTNHTPHATHTPPNQSHTPLAELALLFFRLGATAFGGPAAHIALLEHEVVRRRKWLTQDHFLDLLSATNLIPGPNSTELAIHIGYERRRWPGLLTAGLAFILPAMLITIAIAALYVTYNTLPNVNAILYGIKPAIIAIIAQAIFSLAPKAAKTNTLRTLAALALAALAFGFHELLVLFTIGLLAALLPLTPLTPRTPSLTLAALPAALAAALPGALPAALPASFSLSTLFWLFFKIGSVLFGSGYVLVAFLRAELVTQRQWLTEPQLLDAVAAGQITPGPVFTTATFIGYLLAQTSGALLATLGIFLPAFIFVALSAPFIPRLRASPLTANFLDGVNVASLALMAYVTTTLVTAAFVDLPTIVLGLTSAFLLIRYRLNSTWIIAGAALCGIALHNLPLPHF